MLRTSALILCMTGADLLVLYPVLLISISGILINLLKRGNQPGILKTQDKGSLNLFRLLVPAAITISLVFYFTGLGRLHWPDFCVYAGYLLIIAGLAIRWIAVISLGKAFTVKVSILKNQRLKTDGIYKKVRHPSYSGLLLYYLGLGLVMQNWFCLLILVLAPGIAVWKRIQVEEALLSAHFGEAYLSYVARSRKLIPWIY